MAGALGTTTDVKLTTLSSSPPWAASAANGNSSSARVIAPSASQQNIGSADVP
ncbi:MAG: hypothetical protein IPH76_18840 [Xanthomonadales bacterium]|nr:hypothetical protein [Xanthomonadales bacterium]